MAPGGALLIWGILVCLSPDSACVKNPIANMIATQNIGGAAFDLLMPYSFFCAPVFRIFFCTESQLTLSDSASGWILRRSFRETSRIFCTKRYVLGNFQ